jgi:hypothetical protein
MAEVKFNGRPVVAAAHKALAGTAKELGEQFQKEIEAVKWSWPQNESPRDIIDTGALKASQLAQISGLTADFVWPVEYSGIVHEGNGANYPPRPFVTTALQQRQWNKYYEQLWKNAL